MASTPGPASRIPVAFSSPTVSSDPTARAPPSTAAPAQPRPPPLLAPPGRPRPGGAPPAEPRRARPAGRVRADRQLVDEQRPARVLGVQLGAQVAGLLPVPPADHLVAPHQPAALGDAD